MEFSPMTSCLHYNPFKKKKKAASRSPMEQGVLSGELSHGCPQTNRTETMQLQCGYRGGGHVPTYGRMGWSSSTVLNCMHVSSVEGCAAALGSERAPKRFTAEDSTPLSVVCIFPSERIEKTSSLEDVSCILLQAFPMYFP